MAAALVPLQVGEGAMAAALVPLQVGEGAMAAALVPLQVGEGAMAAALVPLQWGMRQWFPSTGWGRRRLERKGGCCGVL